LKKIKSSHLDRSGHIEGDIMQNHEQKKKVKKVKIQDSMGKTNFCRSGHIEGDIMQNHEPKKRVKNQDSMAKQTSFLVPYPLALGQF
jgi:hypothetical protein